MQVIGGKLEGQWFCEADDLWEGRSMALKIREIVYEAQSQFQHIRVFDSVGAGRVLTLDNIIQLSENDECAYQEMLAHTPLFAHPNPEKVLIIGGGDGGIVREVVRHQGVQSIDLCEIDPQVVEVARKFLPFTA